MVWKTEGRLPKRRLIIALGAVMACLSLTVAVLLINRNSSSTGLQEKRASAPPAIPPVKASPGEKAESLETRREIIHRGQRLADVLKRNGFTAAEIYRLREETKSVYDFRKITAGNEIRLLTTAAGEFRALEYDIDRERYVRVDKEGGAFKAEIKLIPVETKVAMLWARIEDNPTAAVEASDEGDLLAMEMANLFAWDIDFYTDLRRGDTFKLIFEKKFLKGKFCGYGNILAAEFVNQGKQLQAFRFVYPDNGKSDYFDARGNSLRKEFMKSPLKYARVTSRFSLHRLHPIYKVYLAHYGVDYGAPVGTPVQATAEGTVSFASWNGASGRMVKLHHKNGYQTMYLHLSGIAVREGQKVGSGEVIGYVGSSGDATGPHLDYRIQYHGRYINPLGWRFNPVEPLRPEFKEQYAQLVEFYQRLFDSPLDVLLGLG